MKQSRLANLVVMILFVLNSFAIQPLPVNAEGIVPTLTTDKSDYRPEETVQVTGSGFTPGSEVQLPVIRPDGSIIHWVDSSQTFEPGWDTVTTDEYGYLTYFYYLDGVTGQYEIRAYPADWVLGEDQSGLSETPVATVTFTDAAALTLTKSASPLTYTAAGQVINFSYLLQNTGTTMLNGPFTVTDNKVPSVSCPATATLASGASITCTGTYTISSVDAALGYTVNTATASSSNPGATTSNTDVRIVSIPVDCRDDSDGADDVPGQKDLTQECDAPTAVNPLVISWNWDAITQPGGNSADACALFDTNNNGLANYAICVSWQNNRVMQAGYPQLYSCTDTRSDRCTGSTPMTITHGSACALELANDQPFSTGDSTPQDTKAFCSINLADVGGAAISNLIDVCSYPSAVPNSDPSDCVVISAAKGNLEAIKSVIPNDTSTNWDVSWTGPTPYSTTITGSGNTGIQAVNTGSYTITEAAGTSTDLSLYDSTWACTVDGSPSASGSGTTISGISVAKGSVVICTFTNTRKTGSLEIKKDVVPDNASTNWNFAVTGPTAYNCSITGDGTCGAKTIDTGSYNITETAGTGTGLGDFGTSWACTVNGSAGPSGTGTTISGLTVNKSDTVVCTFINSQSPGTLTVNKVVVPSTDTGKFNLQIDGTTKASDVGDGGTTGAVSVSAGSHTVSESAGTGTDLSNYGTTITGDCDSSGNVSISPNQNKTCTITNTRKGTIIVAKQTDPADQLGSFTFTGDAAGTISAGQQIVVSNLAPGTYTSTESSVAADFSLESISCDDGSSSTPSTSDLATKTASFKLDPGETVTCTFTNKKLNPELVVTKTAGASAVTAGDPVGFSISVKNNGQGTANNVTLSDTLPAIPGVTWAIASQPSGNPCTLTGASLSCIFGDLAPGATAGPIQLTGASTAASCGTWNNTATALADNNTEVSGSASIFVDCATIQISKTAASSPISAGDPLSFTITVTNDNSGTAHNVTVTDNLPTNAGLGAWSLNGTDAGACSISSGVLSCNFGDIAGHASKTVTLTATTTAATCGTVSNTASVTTSNDGSDESSATVTVQCPNLSITKTADAAMVNAGDQLGFTITVHNAGPGMAKGVSLTDALPAGLPWTSTPGAPTCTITGQDLSCSLGDLASGADASVHVSATSSPSTCGPLANTATATPTNGTAAASNPATITVNCADVTVTKTGNGPVSAGDIATFTINVSVTGSGSLSNVTLNDPLPEGVAWAIDPSITTCSISGSPQVLSCSWATLVAGTSIEIAVSGATSQANCAAPLSNTATVAAANETDTTNNTASASITVDCPNIQIEKTTTTGTVSAGDPIAYTIKVTNSGAGTARNVTVTDGLPANAGLSWSSTPGSPTCTISGGTLTCSLGDIVGGGSQAITLTSPTTAGTCGIVSNTASVTTTNDGEVASSPATEITVRCPSLTVTKTADADTVSAGDTVGYTITVSNSGPGEAKGVMLSDTLPGGLTWAIDAANTTATGCSITSGTLTCGPDTVASGGSIQVHVTAISTPASCGTLTNTATATPTNGDAATSQESSVTVQCPDLTVAKTGNGPISAGDMATFTITVTNIGAGVAKGVTISDILPGGLTWTVDAANTTATGCAINSGTLICGPDTISGGGSVKVTVSAATTKDNCGTLTNSASAAATNEQNTSNNSSNTVDIEVDCATIQIEKTTTTPTVSAGDPIAYTITVSNPGAGTAKDVLVTDTLPGGLNWDIDAVHSDTGCSISGSTLTCNFGSIASGGSKKVTITAQTSAENCGDLVNSASVTTGNDGAATTPETVITVQCPSLSVAKTADAASVSAGDTIGYMITVSNSGPGEAKGVVIADSLPGGLAWTVDAANTTASNCSINSGSLTCGPDTIASGGSIQVHVTAISTQASCGTLSNSATATATNGSGVTSDPVTTIDVNCPDLVVTKSGNGPISAGDTASFTIELKNNGLGEAKNVSLTDMLPQGVTWALTPDVSGCSISGTSPQVLSCSWATLASGADVTIVLSGNTTANNCGTLNNEVSAAADNEAITNNNSHDASITVNCATIQIVKSTTTPTVSAGSPINFTITVSNTGAGTARNVVVTDSLPTATGLAWTMDPAVTGCSITGGVLTCNLGDIASGGSKSVTLTSPTTAASCGTINNTASVTTTNDGSGQSSASVTVNCPDVTVTKNAANNTVSAGDTITFYITVKNNGTGTAKNVTLSDQLPLGMTWSVNNSGCSVDANGLLTCNFSDLNSGDSTSVTVTGDTIPAMCGTFDNTATIKLDNGPDVDSNTVSVTVKCPDITVTKEAVSGAINAGDTAAFKIVVTNSGEGTAYGVTLTDTLPSGITWSIDPAVAECSITGNTLSCSWPSLAAGATVTINVSGATSAAVCGTLDNTVTVSANNEAANQTNNQASASITVNCADIAVTKEAVTGTISAGDTAAFKIVVTNSGAGTAYNVILTDTLPAGITWTIDPAVTGCAITGNTLSCSFASLAAGAKVEINVSGATSAALCGTLDNTVTVAASNETNTTNNSANASITVNCSDVSVTKEAVTGTINAGDTATFKVVVTNTGSGTAYNVTVNDTLPSGITWTVDPAVTGCAITGNTLECSFATLAAGASIEINVSGTAPAAVCGTLDNTATVAASNENNTDNNAASASITVNCPDITVTKSGNGPVNAGDTATFKIVVSNTGAGTAYNVTVNDTLPAGVTWTIDPAVTGCAITGNTLSCSFAMLAAGASVEIDVSGATSPALCGTLDNTATVAASNEANTTNNSASASIKVACSDLTVTKTGNGPLSAGDMAVFTVTVTNLGPDTATSVLVTDILPAGVTWSVDNPACTVSGTSLSCWFASLAPNTPIVITISGTTSADSCGALMNDAAVSAANEDASQRDNNTATATITVNCPDVKITKTADNASIHFGQDAIFNIVVENTGAGKAYNVTLTDTLPGTVTWSLVQPVPGCTLTGNNLSCAWTSLDPAAKITIQVKATISSAAQCANLTNTVTAAATNEKAADTANNTSTATITVTCPLDLTVSKTANPTFKRTFYWSINKSVDKTLVRQVSSSAVFNYNVTVAETGFTDSDWLVAGNITITNPNDWIDIPLTSLSDTVNNGGICTISGFTAGVKVLAGKSLTFDYTCTYAAKPDPYAGVNTATATWDASIGTPHGSASNTASFAFDTGVTGNPTNINKTVTVTDTFNGATNTLGTVTATTSTPYTSKTFTYSRSIAVTWYPCKSYTNTAKIVETGQTATQTVTVCGPIKTGALTIGYWQNKNGQNIITKTSAVNGVCKLTPWLRQFAPFQDLSATASCKTVASYVTNVIKAANARGASMNAILKAQMLATALDVYFSDPALGGNKISAPAPIGGVTIDLTYVCANPTSCVSYINVSAAFGGATSMKVVDMLIYAASKSNVGGSLWYANVKSTQELAKDAFDAIDNQVAFAP